MTLPKLSLLLILLIAFREIAHSTQKAIAKDARERIKRNTLLNYFDASGEKENNGGNVGQDWSGSSEENTGESASPVKGLSHIFSEIKNYYR
ncbi:hypothetical protein MTO96_051092 [Rhipicephalus appendiculatus]